MHNGRRYSCEHIECQMEGVKLGSAGSACSLREEERRRCRPRFTEKVLRGIKVAPSCRTRGSGCFSVAASHLKAELLAPQMEANCAKIQQLHCHSGGGGGGGVHVSVPREMMAGGVTQRDRRVWKRRRSPGVVPAVRLDEVHLPVFGQEAHQLVVGPEMEKNDSTTLKR